MMGDVGRGKGEDGGGVRSLGVGDPIVGSLGTGEDILGILFGDEVAIIGGKRSAKGRRDRLGGEAGDGDFGGVLGLEGRFCFRRLTRGEVS